MSQPIRILQVVTTMNLGGLENYLINLYRNIDKTKIQFDFLMHRLEKSVFDDEILSMGGNIFRLNPISPKRYFQYKSELKLFLKNHPEYEIIHSHINENNAIILCVAKEVGLKVRIAHSHASATTAKYKFFRELLIKKASKYATHRFACSEAAGKWLFKGNSFIVMNNSIDTRKFSFDLAIRDRVRKSLNINETDTVIGNVSRFSTVKNHFFLLDVFAAYCHINSNTKLILVGDGELRPGLVKKINDFKLNEKVILTGAVTNSSEFLNAMDVYLFPSIREGLPLALIEAQTNGLPTLISDSISNDVILTDLVFQQSLQDLAPRWAESIGKLETNFKNSNRSNYATKIVTCGFDILEATIQLEKFYLDLNKTLTKH